jgi:hypothetical protein
MPSKIKTSEQIEEARLKRRLYMREYKRKSYQKDKDDVIQYHRIRNFQKTNPCINESDVRQFTDSPMKADFVKLLCQLRKIQQVCPDDLQNYLETWKTF